MGDWQQCSFLARNVVVTDTDEGEQVVSGEISLTELKLILNDCRPKPPRP
jgi:hypothetical protein